MPGQSGLILLVLAVVFGGAALLVAARRLLRVPAGILRSILQMGAVRAGAPQKPGAADPRAPAAEGARTEKDLRAAQGLLEQTRSALIESDARLRLALAAADVTIYEIDLERQRVWLDHRATAITGGMLPANVWVDQSDPRLSQWFACLHPDDHAARRAALRALVLGRTEAVAMTYRARGANGAWRWLSERGAVVAHRPGHGAPARIVGVVRDVTEQYDHATALEREVAERTAALRESERRFRSIFDSAFQITGLISCRGRLLQMNRAGLEFFGLAEQEIIGRPLCELGTWADRATSRTMAAHVAAAAAGAFVRREVVMQDREGRPRSFDFSLKPVRDEAGEVAMVVAEARDVTERAALQAQLAQAQKMEAVGQLTGGVAHDFNNLLQTLTGNLDLIHRIADSRGDTRLLHLTANAQRAAGRGARLTQQLLAFSRRQNLRQERVWITRLMAEMGELLHRAAGETVRVETRATLDLWPCHLDPAQFESAVLNLTINARDAMPEGGSLTIAACNAPLSVTDAARLDVLPGDYVRLDVTDTGTGIAPEHLSRLFEPFFTTKEVGKGTGLGLAMVHGFARQAGGAVAVASAPGRGTTLSLFLPRAGQEEAVAPEEAPPPAARPAGPMPARARAPDNGGQGLGILVVEDDPEVREAVEFALADAGHRVVTASDAAGALAVLAGTTTLDLLLCDVALPGGVSGLEVADAARRMRPDLRILLASGYGESLAEAIGYRMMAKPFSQAELLRRVAESQAPAAAD